MTLYILNRDMDKALRPSQWHTYPRKKLLLKTIGRVVKKFKDGYLIWDWNWKNDNLRIENIITSEGIKGINFVRLNLI